MIRIENIEIDRFGKHLAFVVFCRINLLVSFNVLCIVLMQVINLLDKLDMYF